nr:hypothetical protein [Tanacetum cinerariifolium]
MERLFRRVEDIHLKESKYPQEQHDSSLLLAILLYPYQLRKLLLKRSPTSMAFLTRKMMDNELGSGCG